MQSLHLYPLGMPTRRPDLPTSISSSPRRLTPLGFSDVAADLVPSPAATGDLAGLPAIDDDYLVISTAHSAKGPSGTSCTS